MNYSQDEHEYNELKFQFQQERDAEPYYPFTTSPFVGVPKDGLFITMPFIDGDGYRNGAWEVAMIRRPDEEMLRKFGVSMSDELWKELMDTVICAVEGIQHGAMGEQRRGGE